MFNKKNMDKLTKIKGTQSRTKGINLMKKPAGTVRKKWRK